MGENGMRMVNNKCSEVVVLWQQVWKPGQLTEWSIVYPSPTLQEAPIINKQPKLPDERWLLYSKTDTLGVGTCHLQWITKFLTSLNPSKAEFFSC